MTTNLSNRVPTKIGFLAGMKLKFPLFITIFTICAMLVALSSLNAQTASLLPNAKQQFLDNNGKPLTSGTVDLFVPSTTTRKTTWQNAAETIANTNPVVLDAAGRALILGDGSYRQIVKDRLGNVIWDQVTSSTGSGSTSPTATGDGDLVGTIKPWAGMTAPNQYAFTYGQEVSRTTYSVLFTAITSTQAVFCNSGSAILNGLSDTTNFWIGMSVELSCVAAGFSTIISKTATTVTLAVNANITTNTNAIFFPWDRGNGTTTFNLPDLRGFAIAGNNNMGGVAGSQLTTTYFGATNPNSIGAAGGSQSRVLLLANLPAYTPAGTITNGAITTTNTSVAGVRINNTSVGGSSDYAAGGTSLQTLASQPFSSTQAASTFAGTAQGGTSTAFATVQPTKTSNYIIKITPDANSATASGVTSLGGMTGSIACGSGTLCTGNTISVVPAAYASSIAVGATGIIGGTDKGLLYNNAGMLGNLVTANSGVLITNGTGNASISSVVPTLSTLGSFSSVITNPTVTAPAIGFPPLTNFVGISSTVTLTPAGFASGTVGITGSVDNQKGGVTAGALGSVKDSIGSENYGILGVTEIAHSGSNGAVGGFFLRGNVTAPGPSPYSGNNGVTIVNENVQPTTGVANAAIGLYINSLCFPTTGVTSLCPSGGGVGSSDNTFLIGLNVASARDEGIRIGSQSVNGYIPLKPITVYDTGSTLVWNLDNTGNTHSVGYYLGATNPVVNVQGGTLNSFNDSAGAGILQGNTTNAWLDGDIITFRNRNSLTTYGSMSASGWSSLIATDATSTSTGGITTTGGISSQKRGYFNNLTVNAVAGNSWGTATTFPSIGLYYGGTITAPGGGTTWARLWQTDVTLAAGQNNDELTGLRLTMGINRGAFTGTIASAILVQPQSGTLDYVINSLSSGKIALADTTASTTTATGSITSSGGIGIAKALYAGAEVSTATSYRLGTKIAWSATSPSILSGFCTTPSISSNNGTAAFTITIGTACAASTGVLTMPAASTGWACNFRNVTTPASNTPSQTASNTTSVNITNYARTTGIASNWTASEIIVADCAAY